VPFLCHFRRAADISGEGPYVEIASYLRHHSREKVETAFTTLAYFDRVHFATRATVPALFSVGLMDPICPPSAVYAAYNRYAGEDRAISVWRATPSAPALSLQPCPMLSPRPRPTPSRSPSPAPRTLHHREIGPRWVDAIIA
jgi:hypothetical protein